MGLVLAYGEASYDQNSSLPSRSPQPCPFTDLATGFSHELDYYNKQNPSLVCSTFLKSEHLETLILRMTLTPQWLW